MTQLDLAGALLPLFPFLLLLEQFFFPRYISSTDRLSSTNAQHILPVRPDPLTGNNASLRFGLDYGYKMLPGERILKRFAHLARLPLYIIFVGYKRQGTNNVTIQKNIDLGEVRLQVGYFGFLRVEAGVPGRRGFELVIEVRNYLAPGYTRCEKPSVLIDWFRLYLDATTPFDQDLFVFALRFSRRKAWSPFSYKRGSSNLRIMRKHKKIKKNALPNKYYVLSIFLTDFCTNPLSPEKVLSFLQ